MPVRNKGAVELGAVEGPPTHDPVVAVSTGIHQAICEIKAILAKHGGITKDRQAPMGYSFRGIEDLDEVMCGLTAQHGVVVYPRILTKEIRHTTTAKGAYQSHVIIEVEWTYVCSRDGSKHVASTIGEAMDTQDKAFNKAMQAARKYADICVFRIPTSGDDTEAYAPPPPVPEPARPPLAKAGPPPPPPQASSPELDDAMRRIGETNTLPVLQAFAQDVNGYVEPGRSELLRAVIGRACLLFAQAETLDDVKSGYPLAEALGSPEVKSACSKAYARVRKNSHGTGA